VDVGQSSAERPGPHNTVNDATSNLAVGAASDADRPAMMAYRIERVFRLNRLQYRYPQYVHQLQVDRWVRNSFDSPLATDGGFVEVDPARQHTMHPRSSAFSSDSHSGFGGGSSGGGRSGRW
jgi:hypothetical protein